MHALMRRERDPACAPAGSADTGHGLEPRCAAEISLGPEEISLEQGAAEGGGELSVALKGLRLARGLLAPMARRRGQTLRGRWYPHTRALAAALAEMLERCPGRFAHLPLGAADLRAEQRRIDELETARAAAAELLADLDAEIAARKGRLSDAAALLLRAARAQLADPLAPADDLRAAAARALAIVERWSQQRTQARRKTLRTEARGRNAAGEEA